MVVKLPPKVVDLEEVLKKLPQVESDQVHLMELSLGELRKMIKDMKMSNACGVDTINSRVLKDCMPLIEDTLLHLINLSLGTGIFPDCLKVAKVIPLLKAGKDPLDRASYRPISNLSTIGKVLEKAGFNQILNHIKSKGLLNPRHHGGRKGYSTNTCVLEVLGGVHEAKEAKNLVGVLQIDMSSAYDLVSHKLILQQLRVKMGLATHSLKWVESFLFQRMQVIDLYGKTSRVRGTGPQGVVQGGASSGELFTIYLNDIPNCDPLPGQVKPGVEASQFVDDINLVVQAKTKAQLKSALQASYDQMERVLSDHRMVINGGKTQLMIVTKRKELKNITISAAGQTISHQEKIRMLGITLTSALKYDEHIWEGKSAISKSVYKKMSILRNIRPYVNLETLANIGNSLIGSMISYGAPVWAQTTAKNISLLQAAQTKAARLVAGKRWRGVEGQREHRQQMFENLRWTNVKQLTSAANLNLLKQALSNASATSVNLRFSQSQPTHQRGANITRVDYRGKADRPSGILRFKPRLNLTFCRTISDPPSSPLNASKFYKKKIYQPCIS